MKSFVRAKAKQVILNEATKMSQYSSPDKKYKDYIKQVDVME